MEPFPAPSPFCSLTVSLSPQSLSPQERAAYKEHISNVSILGALLCWDPRGLEWDGAARTSGLGGRISAG